jgi:demethylmenaquinone methyltransferase/2-methoxy-6-polyprenyl-1,4-benzoquinol methylase
VQRGTDEERLLQQQVRYYRARADEYDEWFTRRDRYDRGPVHRKAWFDEVSALEGVLNYAALSGDVLELASGTGWWTRRLVTAARRIVAVDTSPEVLEINRSSVGDTRVAYVVGDVFLLPLCQVFDAVFFSFWLSHVPATRFEQFWTIVRRALRPGGRVFFIDSLLESSSTASDHPAPDASGVVRRRLNDGREFEIVKVFYEADSLMNRLRLLGWDGEVRTTGKFFVYGQLVVHGSRLRPC